MKKNQLGTILSSELRLWEWEEDKKKLNLYFFLYKYTQYTEWNEDNTSTYTLYLRKIFQFYNFGIHHFNSFKWLCILIINVMFNKRTRIRWRKKYEKSTLFHLLHLTLIFTTKSIIYIKMNRQTHRLSGHCWRHKK